MVDFFQRRCNVKSWPRKGSKEEDKMIADSIDVIFQGIADGDFVTKVEATAGKNLREQMTQEKMEELERERQLRRFERRN